MPPLTPVVDDLNTLPEPVRQYYESRDGKFHLSLGGTPTGFVTAAVHNEQVNKVTEFRNTNITLKQENDTLKGAADKFKDIDPDKAKSAIAKVAELEAKGVKEPSDI